jgi:chemotaxis protein CheX
MVNVAYLNPFVASTRRVFETMLKVPFRLGKPYLKKGNERLYKLFGLSATLDFSGPAEVFFSLNVSEPAVLSVVSGLTGTRMREMNSDCCDALAEIANMIANGAKKDLPASGFHVSLPRVIRPHRVEYPTGMPIVAIPADTGVGRFMLELGMRATAGEAGVSAAAS